jgi:hypothetical protein
MQIISKTQFFMLWEKGMLGNRTNLWRDPVAAFHSGAPEIGFREMGKSGGGAWEKVPRGLVMSTAQRWTDAGRSFIMDDGCPDWCRTLQGEVCRTVGGLYGYLDTSSNLPMRPAMAGGFMRHCSGATTLALIQRFMDPQSQDDLWALLDLYPDAVVEFSCFGVDVGVLPNRNTLMWETRCY